MGTPIDPGVAQGDPNGSGNTPGPNPAWNDVLGQIPEQYHSVLTENFQKWDQAAQQRIETANASVKAFEPYKAFVDNGIPPEEIENGLRIIYEINSNPKSVWEAIGNAYDLTPQQVQKIAEGTGQGDPSGNGQQPNSPQSLQDPRFDRLQQGIELVSQIVLNDQQAKQQALEDQKLDNEIKDLEKNHGKFDQSYVLAMMQNGMSGDEAVQAFQSMRNSILQDGSSFAPNILGSGGSGGSGYPSQAIDPTKLTGKGTRDLVAQMLDAANRQP